MATGAPDSRAEKSYLSSAVDSINPWAASRSTTPTRKSKLDQSTPSSTPVQSEDHSITHLYGQSLKTYPAECPPLKVQWYHAVDVAKRKPRLGSSKQTPTQPEKPQVPPKKYSAFSAFDSRALENEYQKLLEATEESSDKTSESTQLSSRKRKADTSNSFMEPHLPSATDDRKNAVRVPVNEDFLFDVDIEVRELAPVYWLGPVYEVRRGTWFYQEGSSLRPCEENLAAQLEEGYLKLKPWRYPLRDRSPSGAKRTITPKASKEKLTSTMAPISTTTTATKESDSSTVAPKPQAQLGTYRLFGTYMNSIVTYQDSSTAWLSSEGMLSWVTSSVYQRFTGGGYMSGIKLIRGHAEASKTKEKEKVKEKEKEKSDGSRPATPENALSLDERQQKLLKRRSAPPLTYKHQEDPSQDNQPDNVEADPRQVRLHRQLSSLLESESKTKAEKEEEVRRREEQEIQEDYNAQAGETQGRDIEHLVLVTHGIGQLLSLRMESVNFVHDVNILRKTIKSVYSYSADLKALNSDSSSGPGNCRVQVLPVCWRHLLDFPKKREKKGELDIGEIGEEEDDYPSLDDITIEGVAFARSLISDLALDVLLYQSAYRDQIARIVLVECNRIYKLFKERNPEFKGKVHLMGHSLGSAILFDLLCQQKQDQAAKMPKTAPRPWVADEPLDPTSKDSEVNLSFNVEDFFCLGSPIGLFQMLKGQTVGARPTSLKREDEKSLECTGNASHKAALNANSDDISPVTGLPASVASPKVQQLFNIFHPSDPISYRIEPLISPSMSSLKPQQLPYTKRGIFGNVAPQGLTGIGAKVGQSVSGLWSSLSAGIASNLLNRSLGLTNDEVARINANESQSEPRVAGSNKGGTGVAMDNAQIREATDARMKQLAETANANRGNKTEGSGHGPTLIDDEIETLYSKFKQSHTVSNKDGETISTADNDRKSRKLRREESKVRALNRNGRVDYSIQESVLDFNPMNTIASHMCYWADEDVNHFVLSQLLSNRTPQSKET